MATVVPTVETMLDSAQLIITGRVVDVENPGGKNRLVTIRVDSVLRHPVSLDKLQQVRIHYTRLGKGNVDFMALEKSNSQHLFYLVFVPARQQDGKSLFQLQLSDAWFGVEPADPERLRAIRALLE